MREEECRNLRGYYDLAKKKQESLSSSSTEQLNYVGYIQAVYDRYKEKLQDVASIEWLSTFIECLQKENCADVQTVRPVKHRRVR